MYTKKVNLSIIFQIYIYMLKMIYIKPISICLKKHERKIKNFMNVPISYNAIKIVLGVSNSI